MNLTRWIRPWKDTAMINSIEHYILVPSRAKGTELRQQRLGMNLAAWAPFSTAESPRVWRSYQLPANLEADHLPACSLRSLAQSELPRLRPAHRETVGGLVGRICPRNGPRTELLQVRVTNSSNSQINLRIHVT